MRRRQFSQLITSLRAEIGQSVDPAVGVGDLPRLKQLLSRHYETLYDSYNWPHLRHITDRIPLQPGERYYDFPDTLDFDNLEKVVVWWSGQPCSLTRGIGFEQYAAYSSEDDDRVDPVQRWDVRYTGPKEMIEVWPLPASNAQSLQFFGKLKYQPLINDSDLCLLDDHLVVLFAAVELMPAKSNLQLKLAAAQQRVGMLKANSTAERPTIRMGLGQSSAPLNGKSVVRIGG